MNKIENFETLFKKQYDIKDIARVNTYTSKSFYSTQDGNFETIKFFNGLDNYYEIIMHDGASICLGDYTSYDGNNQILKDYINNMMDKFTIQELNSFIKKTFKSMGAGVKNIDKIHYNEVDLAVLSGDYYALQELAGDGDILDLL